MNDQNTLELLREAASNAITVIKANPFCFYRLFRDFIDDLGDMSDHIYNDNFRNFYLRMISIRVVSKAYWDYIFQNLIIENLPKAIEKDQIESREIILAAIGCIDIEVCGDVYGRDSINVGDLQSAISEELKNLDNDTRVYIVSRITFLIRTIQTTIEDAGSQHYADFFKRVIEATGSGWTRVFSVLDDYTIKLDKVALTWQRRS